ncbi:Dam family site-specific DNA-(adenine-N6)-methyltransferase [candidate division KSB3 bacterium]|uniref:site-specific DNA-methyltransferase (adenine-specific) n=1 Tax=candidate division KSB3 bacterium TaxID=2044937 RepID=A0A9D5JU48_9BACT|nr:Dam family site-specific DNA-(adenine-N6)-methyltransferase [candidate division KSB3 bacterium]MBD3324130.1 Dam family site-specific DNA-(adenine-N6)-methyltransferase [candidate division KSB3 bacterium]
MTPSLDPNANSLAESQAPPIPRNAKPFLKWAGGKQQLLAQYESYFPIDFRRYIEPFVGGGAVFFHLWNTHRLHDQVFLFDHNDDLINTYKVVRDNVDALIRLLASHNAKHRREYYYAIRNLDRQHKYLDEVERAARTIYLNKTCYNGLYRVNSKGQFNVPMGSYNKPAILQKNVLKAASMALQGVCLEAKDFQTVVDLAQPEDFFYFDPPYAPLSKTSSFTSYTAGNFGDEDQQSLADVFRQLSQKGCFCMLSNSDTPSILPLYQDFRIETVQASRAINSNSRGRGSINEIVILNY